MAINNILNVDVYKNVLSDNEESLKNKVKSNLREILTESAIRGDKKIEISASKLGSHRMLEFAKEILRYNGWNAEIHNSQRDGEYLLATFY